MLDEDDVLDSIEDEILEEQKRLSDEKKNKTVQSLKIEGSEEDKENYVVKNNPDISSSYKDRLVRVYDELTNLNTNDLDSQIADIKEQLRILIEEIEENDKRIRASVTNKIDKTLQEDKDFHYVSKTKACILKPASEPIFTPSNILLFCLTVAIFMVGIIILAYWG